MPSHKEKKMAAVGLLALLDDIASVLDDVALMTKVAAKKTAGVLGDDLALNARQVAGVAAEREIPVVLSVAKGSFVNKLILIPAALAISAFVPALITPLLMLGGAYLCYEGAEKLLHRFLPHDAGYDACKKTDAKEDALEICVDPAAEKAKIRAAVRTDFILSAEIIVIALGTVPKGASFAVTAMVVSAIGLVMTVGVYGLVAGIVKLDDAGFWLLDKEGAASKRLGSILVGASPKLMRFLGVAGTFAMFTVGGGILAHGLPFFHVVSDTLAALPAAVILEAAVTALFGVAAGAMVVAVVACARKVFAPFRRKNA